MPKTLIFPPGVDDNLKKYIYCYRIQELLRLKYNDMGLLYKTGQITEIQWKQFCKTWEEYEKINTNELLNFRALAKNNNNWDPEDVYDSFTN